MRLRPQIGIGHAPRPRQARLPVIASHDFMGGTLDGGSLTRGSTGRRINSSGVLVSEAINAARFDHDGPSLALRGLLYEPARTNAFLRSETFDNASWTKVNATVTADQGVAPDGATTADKLFENATNSSHYTQQTFSATSGTTYTMTVHVKAAERAFFGLACNQIAGGSPTVFVLSGAGSIGLLQSGHTADIEALANGWYRCRLTVTATSTTTASFRCQVCSDFNAFLYAGSTSNGVLIWGAQMEVAASPSSYIPTTTAGVARSADVLSLTAPAGTATARYTFDDLSTQDVATSAGAFNVPTNLNRPRLRRVDFY